MLYFEQKHTLYSEYTTQLCGLQYHIVGVAGCWKATVYIKTDIQGAILFTYV